MALYQSMVGFTESQLLDSLKDPIQSSQMAKKPLITQLHPLNYTLSCSDFPSEVILLIY